MNLLKKILNYSPKKDSILGYLWAQYSEEYRKKIGGHWEYVICGDGVNTNLIWVNTKRCTKEYPKDRINALFTTTYCEDYPIVKE